MKYIYLTDDFSLLSNPVPVTEEDHVYLMDAAQGTYGSLVTRPIWSEHDPILEAVTHDGFGGNFLAVGWNRPEGGSIPFVGTSPTPPVTHDFIVCWSSKEKKLYKEGN